MSKIHFAHDNSFSIENLNILFKKSGVLGVSDSDTELEEDGTQTEIIINSKQDIIDNVKGYIKKGCKSEREVRLNGWNENIEIGVFNRTKKKLIVIKNIKTWEYIKKKITNDDFPKKDIDSIEVVVAEQVVSSNNIIGYVKEYIKKGCINEHKATLIGWDTEDKIRVFNITTKKLIFIENINTWEDIIEKIKADDFPTKDIDSIEVVVAKQFISLRPPPQKKQRRDSTKHEEPFADHKETFADHEKAFKDLLNEILTRPPNEIENLEVKRNKAFQLVKNNKITIDQTDRWVYKIFYNKPQITTTTRYNSTTESKKIHNNNKNKYESLQYTYSNKNIKNIKKIAKKITFAILEEINQREVKEIAYLILKLKPADDDPPESEVNMWE